MSRFVLTLPYWFFSVVLAVYSVVIIGTATKLSFAEVAPHLMHYAETTKLPLYAHVILGPLALFLAPFQFWKGLRTRRPRVHRIIGYAYVGSIAIAGLSVLPMLVHFKGTTWAATGFLVLTVGWLGATMLAVWFAQQRSLGRHRRWMLRSAALTFAAVTLRIEMIPLLMSGMSIAETYNVTAWLSWLLPLLYVEWLLRFANREGGRTSVQALLLKSSSSAR